MVAVSDRRFRLNDIQFQPVLSAVFCVSEPDVLNTKIYDEIIKAPNEAAFATAKLLAKKEGISVGISSGAALYGAIELAKRPENKGKVIVALLPDSGDRYYSTALFTED